MEPPSRQRHDATARRRRAASFLVILWCALVGWPASHAGRSVSFAVIGDSGTGKAGQYAVARAMEAARLKTPFSFVLMLGDNLYGEFQGATSFTERFEKPYASLLRQGVKFHASLGNHGNADAEARYEPFGMGGKRFYTFTAGDGLAQFFALESDTLDARPVDSAQLAWLESELKTSTARWKVAFFHHPIYNAGLQHGPNLRLRALLEPLFLRYGVRLVLSGHEHVYERFKPQGGVLYFVSGSAGKVKTNDIDRSSPLLAAGNDTVCSFILFELTEDDARYSAISAFGETFDSGAYPVAGQPK